MRERQDRDRGGEGEREGGREQSEAGGGVMHWGKDLGLVAGDV
jgi:hypothetical protein